MNKQKIIGIVIVLLLFAGIGYKVYSIKHPKPLTPVTATTEGTTGTSTTSSGSTSTVGGNTSGVSIETPQRPINGVMKGVIEVGASGFNSFVVNIDKDKNWEIVTKDFGESLAYEGFATVDDIKLGLKKYLAAMFNKGVNGRNAHFVMSSGALKNPKTKDIAAAIKSMGYVVNEVSADQEGKYALKSLLSPKYKDNSFTVDMGSGNTKISWYEGAALKSKELPGAKYFQDGKLDQDVYAQVKAAAASIPSSNRGQCFIIGGVPYNLAKQARSNDNERYTVLKSPDDYSAGDDVKIKSGLNIYRAIIDATGTTTYVFDWDANFTIGFLLSIN